MTPIKPESMACIKSGEKSHVQVPYILRLEEEDCDRVWYEISPDDFEEMVLPYWEEIEGYTESECLLAIPGRFYFEIENEAFFFSMFDEQGLFLDLDLSGILVQTPYQHWESKVEQSGITQPTFWDRVTFWCNQLILRLRVINAPVIDIPHPEQENMLIFQAASLPIDQVIEVSFFDDDENLVSEDEATEAYYQLSLKEFLAWESMLHEEHCDLFQIKGHWCFLYLSENPMPICKNQKEFEGKEVENIDVGYYLCTDLREADKEEVLAFLYWYMRNNRISWEYEPEFLIEEITEFPVTEI